MNILCATDDNYVPYCGVMLTSLFENNRQEKIHVFILTGGINIYHQKKLKELADTYSQIIDIIIVDAESFNNCPIRPDKDHVSIATYYRLAVTELLPQDIDRILYLDCDMIIHSSINDLYNTNISQYACAAVVDEAFLTNAPYERLNIKKDLTSPYFNAGMLLINMAYWRKHNIMEKCLDYISINKNRLTFHDQDTLNAVLHKNILYVHPRYNLQRGHLYKCYFDNYNYNLRNFILEAINSPVIIHYTGAGKPWIEADLNPLNNIWLRYHAQSRWNNLGFVHIKRDFHSQILRFRNEVIWRLGIKKRPYAYIISSISNNNL